MQEVEKLTKALATGIIYPERAVVCITVKMIGNTADISCNSLSGIEKITRGLLLRPKLRRYFDTVAPAPEAPPTPHSVTGHFSNANSVPV